MLYTTTKTPIKLTTTRSPKAQNVTTTKVPIPVPTINTSPIVEIKVNDKIDSLFSQNSSLIKTRDFLCYVEGLSSVEFFSDPNGLPDLFAVYGVKDISQVRSNALPGLLKHISTKAETKTIDVSGYKYILININKDVPVTGNDFNFIVKGDSNLLKSPILVPNNIIPSTTKAPTTTLRPTTTKAPVTTKSPNTTTKSPVTTTKAPDIVVKTILDNSTLIKMNTKVTDFDKSKNNSFVCLIEGLQKVSVFMNPFVTQNSFIITGIDMNNKIVKLFSSSWSRSSKLVPLDVSKYKYLQIIVDNSFVSGNSFEIKILGDEKLLKSTIM